jgi:hypothetical protein
MSRKTLKRWASDVLSVPAAKRPHGREIGLSRAEADVWFRGEPSTAGSSPPGTHGLGGATPMEEWDITGLEGERVDTNFSSPTPSDGEDEWVPPTVPASVLPKDFGMTPEVPEAHTVHFDAPTPVLDDAYGVAAFEIQAADAAAGGSKQLPYEPEELKLSLDSFMAEVQNMAVSEQNTEALDAVIRARLQRDAQAPISFNDKALAAYDDAVAKNGKFKMRGTLAGNKFFGEHKDGTPDGDRWRAAPDKMAFKKEWAERKKLECIETRKEEKSWQEIDETVGEYVTLGALVVSFGGWEWREGVDGAKLMFARCVAMGGKWVWTCSLSKLVHVLKVKKIHKEIFSNKWQKFLEEVGGGGEAAIDGSSRTGETRAKGTKEEVEGRDAAKKGGTAEPKGKAKAHAKNKAEAKGKAAGKAKMTPAELESKQLNDTIKAAMSVKSHYIKVVTMAKGLIGVIEGGHNKNYDFAKNEQQLGLLQKELVALESKLNPVGQEVLLHEIKDLKSKYGSAKMAVQLKEFAGMSGDICKVQKVVDTIMKRARA